MKKILVLSLISFSLLGVRKYAATYPPTAAIYNTEQALAHRIVQAGVDKQDPTDLTTALHWAVRMRNAQLAEELVSNGASRDIPDADGVTARQLMRLSNNLVIRALADVALEA